MGTNRKKLGALLCALAVTALVAGTATASQSGGTPGVSKKQIVIGGTFPLTGPAALYKTIPAAELAYYAYVNKKYHGVFGRKIKDIVIDDQYDPGQTPAAVKKLVEQDHVLGVVGSLGTAPALATWDYLNKHKVPQVLLATGDAYWGNCVAKTHPYCTTKKPWTEGWQPDYPSEARLYAKYVLKHKPNAQIGILYQNDSYGTNYLNAFKAGLGASHQNQVVDAESYNVTDSSQVIQGHVVSIRAHGADTFVIFATPSAAITSLATETGIGWSPLTILNNVSANRVFMLIAEQHNAQVNGVVSTTYIPSQTAQPSLAGMKLAKKIINATGNQDLINSFNEGDNNLVYGLAVGWTFVDALKHAGKNPTRKSFMRALRHLNEKGKNKNPFVYPGMVVQTSKTRTFPMEQLIIQKWAGQTGQAPGDWKASGKIINSGH